MQIKRIALGGIIMTVIMFSGCSTTVQNLAIGEEKTLETGKTEQESVTEKDINMNEKESFNAESNINDVIHDSAFDDYGRLIFPVDMEIEDNLKLKFEAQKYITDMIIVALQLNDWGQTSADQTIELTQYFLTHYIINPSKVYINGYSGGGETLSLVLAKQPELYTAALMCSSQWDGAYEPVVEMKTPVYFVIGESDEYYGSEPFKEAYQQIHELYKEQGLSESEIDKLVVLDVKDKDYFEGTPVTYQHGGGYLFCRDKEIMGWLFNQ